MTMNEKIYKTMSNAGAANIAAGVMVLVAGVIGLVAGILMLVHGGKLLKNKKNVMI